MFLITHYRSIRIRNIIFVHIIRISYFKDRLKNVGDSMKSQCISSTPVSFYAHGWQFSFYFISGESSHENFKTFNHFAITASKYMPCGILEMDTNDKRKMGSWWEQWNISKIIQHVIQSLLKAVGLLDSS